MSPAVRRSLRLLGSVLGVLGVAFVALQLFHHWDQVDPGRLSAHAWSLVALLAAVYAGANLMLAMAWGRVLAFVGIDVSRCWAVRAYGLSQIAKYVPGNVFHLAGRQALGMAAGLPSAALLKSLIWELGLIAATGCLFGLLVLPLLAAGWPIGASLLAFAIAAALMVTLANRWLAPSVGAALLWHIAFLLVSGAVFVGAMAISAQSPWSLGLVMTVAGAYVVAWLIGLVTPGAPAGVGVRELALLYMLGSQFAQADLLIAVVLARFVTVTGDLAYFVGASRIPDWHPQRA
jgi:glycosyltransferase 2 family protein